MSYSGIAQADAAYTVMTALTKFPAGQNLLVEPAPQTGTPGPVTLTLGTDFAGVKAPAAQTAELARARKPGKKSPGSGSTSTVLSTGGQDGPNAFRPVTRQRTSARDCPGRASGSQGLTSSGPSRRSRPQIRHKPLFSRRARQLHRAWV